MSAGIQTKGFGETASLINKYNYSYYQKHLSQLGFEKQLNWVEYKIQIGTKKHEGLERLGIYVSKKFDLELVQLKSRKELKVHADEIMDIYLEAYSKLDNFIRLTPNEITFYKNLLSKEVYPPYVLLIKNKQKNVVAFSIASPSITSAFKRMKGNRTLLSFWYIYQSFKKLSKAELNLIAVKDEWKGKGLPALIMSSLWDIFNNNGVTEVESNHELESNKDVQGLWRFFDIRQHKARSTFTKSLI
jgi:hypothetical protein